MGSSAKRKSDKKKDFKKPKLKVGKSRPKPNNVTDTSFKSKSIVLKHQSLSATAPSQSTVFCHHLSLLSSRSSTQRRESIAYLTNAIASRPVGNPILQPLSVLLPKLQPLVLDESNGVRAQVLCLLKVLPPREIEPHIGSLLLYFRAGLTHLGADIRASATDLLLWAIEICPDEVVSCAGGWMKTLKCLITVLHWHAPEEKKRGSWTSVKAPNLGNIGSEGKLPAKILNVLAALLHAGLVPDPEPPAPEPSKWPFPLRNVECHMISKRSNAYAYLNLFGPPRDEEGEMYTDREERQRIFHKRFQSTVEHGLQATKREGGEIGRAAAGVEKALKGDMDDFEPSDEW
ncbi:rRNA processing protein [Lecanora helva]